MHVIVLWGLVFAAAASTAAQDSLQAAKDLYAAAAYDEALAALTRLHEANEPAARQQVDEYRSFCLYALGRTAEAEAVAESLLRADPQMQLDGNQASPRIEAMFAAVRKRLLPDLIREEYRLARAARDANAPAEAETHLVAAKRLLDSAQAVGAWNESLADLAMLVEGFLDLARSSQRPPTTPAPAPVPTREAPASSAPAPPAAAPRVFDGSDRDVAPPVAIRQVIPPAPRELVAIIRATGRTQGVLAVLVDETGAVRDAVMREPLSPGYDTLIINAARGWKYRPATKGGTAVPYVKTIAIAIEEKE